MPPLRLLWQRGTCWAVACAEMWAQIWDSRFVFSSEPMLWGTRVDTLWQCVPIIDQDFDPQRKLARNGEIRYLRFRRGRRHRHGRPWQRWTRHTLAGRTEPNIPKWFFPLALELSLTERLQTRNINVVWHFLPIVPSILLEFSPAFVDNAQAPSCAAFLGSWLQISGSLKCKSHFKDLSWSKLSKQPSLDLWSW